MSQPKAVTVTFNPALDMTGHMACLTPGNVNLIQKASINPGGKGINVAKVLAELGAKVTVTGFLGDENQGAFVSLFSQKNIDDQFIRVSGASRINVKLVEQEGRVTDLNFPGIEVTEKNIFALEKKVFELALSHEIFVLAGSLPKGMPIETLKSWIERLGNMGKKVFFDSSNEALKEGMKAKPWLIKPNDDELSQWAGELLEGETALIDAGMKLSKTGIKNVVISRGSKGVLWLRNGQVFSSQPPKMKVVSTVGAGDTLVAGFCWAQLQLWNEEDSLRFATALSALAVTQVNVGVEDCEALHAFLPEIKLSTLNNASLQKETLHNQTSKKG